MQHLFALLFYSRYARVRLVERGRKRTINSMPTILARTTCYKTQPPTLPTSFLPGAYLSETPPCIHYTTRPHTACPSATCHLPFLH